MKRVLLALALLCAPAVAQQPAPRPDEEIQKVVTVKYVDPEALRNLLANFGIITRVDSRLKVITLSGTRSRVTTAEDAIKQLDVPAAAQKDIELTVYFVVASDQPNLTPAETDSAGPAKHGRHPEDHIPVQDLRAARRALPARAVRGWRVQHRTTERRPSHDV